MVLLTWKFRINPSKKQEELLWKLSETCRILYNHALDERKFLYDAYKYAVSYRDQQNALPQLKKHYSRYNYVYSKVLQMTLKKLDGAFQAFLDYGRMEMLQSSYQPSEEESISLRCVITNQDSR